VVKQHGAVNPGLVCIVSSPEGAAEVECHHPGTTIHTAAHDRELNAKKYILPGLGDFGDRLYGT
jgi:uracil phosphoribosyltransferase